MSQVKVFSRESPATKIDLWNCFRRAGGYPAQTVVHARTIIGANAPKYLVREGYAREFSAGGVDFYQLTHHGIAWLEKGVKRYLELHPEAKKDLLFPLPGSVPAKRVIRRARG